MREFFALRLNRIKVGRNREIGPAEVKILSFAGTAGSLSLPSNLQDMSEDDRRTVIRAEARHGLQSRTFLNVENVRDGHVLTFGDTGYTVYTLDRIPDSFDWSLFVFESDRDVVEWGAWLDGMLDGPEFDSLYAKAMQHIAGGVEPTSQLWGTLVRWAFSGISNRLASNRDDQVGLVYQSFNRWEHYPHGIRVVDDVPDLSGNLVYDYAIVGLPIP